MERREPRNSEVAAQMATLLAMVATLKLDTERQNAKIAMQDAKIAALQQQREAPHAAPIRWVALKAALPPGVSYETARSWCERGYVTARKQGGRWFVNPESLRSQIALRLSGPNYPPCIGESLGFDSKGDS
jgi:hypothetical protein